MGNGSSIFNKRRHISGTLADTMTFDEMPSSQPEVRVIVLERGEKRDAVVHRILKGWHVRFVRGTSLLACGRVLLKTSLTGDAPLEWSEPNDPLSATAEVVCDVAGAFEYTFSVDDEEKTSGSGHFLVFPALVANDKELPLDGIACITHLAKLLGPLSEWESRLQVAKECGYNMIHFTPVHQLGVSDSSYSIRDFHALNDTMHSADHKATFDELKDLVSRLEREWGVLSVQDVVWNHAAKNADWLQEHPDSAYNCENSRHLRPAYVVDRAYHYFGKEVSEGKWAHANVPACIDNVHHIHSIEYLLRTEVLPKLRLHEFYQCNLDDVVRGFEEACRSTSPSDSTSNNNDDVTLLVDPDWRRFGRRPDLSAALAKFNQPLDASSEEERVAKCSAGFRSHLEHLNSEGAKYSWDVVMSGLRAILGHITYERVAAHGPRKGLVTEKNPLLTDYFLHTFPEVSWVEDEKLAFVPDTARHLMVFNGWVMSSDPMKNFALSDSEVYLRRELVCWGDSVKLNYGNAPEDSPFLWNYMKEYTEQVARIFHGVRIDNAHGTPIHVAEYLLRAARAIRPDLYSFAELFSGSERADNIFVNRLGITSLIREAQSAPDSHEQGRLVYRFGGDCVGAMRQKRIRKAEASVAHAMLLDQSHDNPTPIQTRSPWDLLPTAAMVSMASCAVGSTRGYDELIRHAINVVTEKRPYGRWGVEVNEKSGLVAARRLLNNLHTKLANEGYQQVFVDQMNPSIVGITRHDPISHRTVVLVAHTAFNGNGLHQNGPINVRWIPIGGVLEEILFEMKVVKTADESDPESKETLVGLTNFGVEVHESVPFDDSKMCKLHGGTNGHIELTEFPAGAVIAFRVRLLDEAQTAVNYINEFAEGRLGDYDSELRETLGTLPYSAFHFLFFCTEGEEQAIVGRGAYEIPNFGKFVYCGLMGIVPVLVRIREHNDLGHPLCQNLRDGCWLPEYIWKRLAKYGSPLEKVSSLFSRSLSVLSQVPYYLRPCYFEAIVQHLFEVSRACLLEKLHRSPFVPNSRSPLLRSLLLSTTSFVAHVPGATLAPLADDVAGEETAQSLSAGLPHFSTGIWRNWGRDTFIALPGCLLVTGRFDDARKIILSFAGSMRHGLIPNLLAEGIGARFNCRDAVWFWLYAIVRYSRMAPDGDSILVASVKRIYPQDDTEYGSEYRVEPLKETIVEALTRHFAGISFRERNAGSRIDEHMKDEGFYVSAGVDKTTGFIRGGNEWNCGTWMDKMGSSDKAGNRGVPATPRDGAAVELQGLAVAVLRQMQTWAEQGKIAQQDVTTEGITWTWNQWADRICDNFNKLFYVDDDCEDKFANRRGVVKDCVGSTHGFTDFQLRPNFCIALAVAPELLPPDRSWRALNTAKDALLGPLGIKTLDPTDWAYNGFYNNDDDGVDKKTAKGWNYHQGPEWVWVAGFYLKARIAVGRQLGGAQWHEAKNEVETHLGRCQEYIASTVWRSLPELTQEGGVECAHSCSAQAWSVGTMLEAYCDLS